MKFRIKSNWLFLFFTISLIISFSCCQSQKEPEDLPIFIEETTEFQNPALKPFYHGVASGDPLTNAVVIWTRVTPEEKVNEIKVSWEFAEDKEFEMVLEKGVFVTDSLQDYTVKINVDELDPNTYYYYRFKALNGISTVGRTKTAPIENANLKFAVASCSNLQWGYFNAYQGIAKEDSLDAVIHLGDYIYEHGEGVYADTSLERKHVPKHEIVSLGDYRTRYSQYRLDSDLQAAHAEHPFIAIWDDHEITNNAYMDGAQNHQDEEGDYKTRTEIAKKVYYEWMPIRESEHLYRELNFGEMADLFMLDERLDGRTKQVDSINDPTIGNEDRHILGENQMKWLEGSLINSKAKWKIIGNQVIFSYQDWGYPNFKLNTDGWDGYPVEQANLTEFLRSNNLENVIFITGDTHSSWAFEVTNDPFNSYDTNTSEGAIAIEFGVTSITSANSDEGNPKENVINHEKTIVGGKINPHLKYANMRDHGYLLLELSDSLATGSFKMVETVKERKDSMFTDKVISVKNGEHKLNQIQ
ncbi:alkaline phosphatase D family protein [Aegicerativicinus sediminis]|uniref:alkaline phosphatase D family protein n=1 Tax=Aegicerativicinus sediminis TaxID=2893202 RepID=UPI001E2C4B82|nr:alkaline phosphatase D family protein [Aegicerativicinus sediminis]